MRVVKEVVTKHGKITIFSWNNRYLIKVEQALLEQTYKINQFDVSSEEELLKIIDDTFLDECAERFEQMSKTLHDALHRAGQMG